MELPTSLEQRIALLKQEISSLVAQVWNLDLNQKKILAVQAPFLYEQVLLRQDFAQQQFDQELVAEEVLLSQGVAEQHLFNPHLSL